METQSVEDAPEIKHLQRCMSDLVSVLALPAVWSGQDPPQITATFCDALIAMLHLDFLYARASLATGESPIETLKLAPPYGNTYESDQIRRMLLLEFGDDPQKWPAETRSHLAGEEISLLSMRLGLDGEIGVVVAGSRRADFPQQTERLLLNVGANQMAVGLQQARLLNQQKRIADELEQRVTERTRELAQANEELRLQVGLLQHLPVSAWTLKPDGTPDFVNQVWLQFSGQTLDFVRSHPEAWMTAVHPEDREAAARAFWEGVRSGRDFALETRSLRASDQTYRWHLQQAVVLRDAEGKVLRFVGTTTDIDDQKRAEDELRASEANLRRVIDAIPTLSWCALPDGPNVFLSKGWCQYTGFSTEEALGWGWQAAYHPEDRPHVDEHFKRMLASGEPGEIEARLRRRDGAYRWFLMRAAPFRDETGAILRWYGTSTDIHDRKVAEEAMRASEANLRRVIDTIPSLSWCNLPDGPNEFLSKGWHDYTGLSPEEAHGWGWSTAFHPDDLPPLMKRWQELLVSGEPGEIEARIRRNDGVYRWFLIRVAPFRDENGAILRWYGTSTDIDDRKLAEQALKASENNLRQIVDSIPGLVCAMDAAGEVQQLNRPLLDYFGKAAEDLKNWKMTDAVHPDDLPRVIEAYTHSITTGTPYDIEHRCLRADGVYRWFQVRALAVRDTEMKIRGWYVLLTDIDDRKRAEEALRASESNFRQIVDGIPGLVAALSPSGEIELLNQRLLEYYGKSIEEMRHWETSDVIHPDDRARSVAIFTSSMQTGAPHEVEQRCRRADGVYRWFQLTCLPVRDIEGRITRWYVLLTDIDDRKRAEQELHRSEAFLAEGQRLSRTGTFSWRPRISEFSWSQELYRLFELDPNLPSSLELASTRIHPEDLPSVNEIAVTRKEEIRDYEHSYRIILPGGRLRFMHVVAHATRTPDGEPEYIGAVQDVTQRVLSEEALTKARSELANATREMSLGVLTASIAHEVNQPLSGVVTNASTCLRMLHGDAPNIEGARETARRIIRDGNRASDVVARLRKLFSQKEIAAELIDLNEAAREVIALCINDLQRNRVLLRQQFTDELPPIKGDRVQLQQVILNLVRNASDAMSAIEDRPRQLRIATGKDESGRVCLTVADTGIGFDAQQAETLFQPFHTTKSDGMGIGLSISRSIVEAHSGRMWAAANDGPGATFAFCIPPESAPGAAAASTS
jgi:PAS domain S-box-containing protein